jgi:hypothetical protein
VGTLLKPLLFFFFCTQRSKFYFRAKIEFEATVEEGNPRCGLKNFMEQTVKIARQACLRARIFLTV